MLPHRTQLPSSPTQPLAIFSSNTTHKLILQCHIDECLDMSGKTCWSSNDECVEAVHQFLGRRNLRHGLKKTKNLIGSYKRKFSAMP